MRIDREGFLVLAISTLAGCERADTLQNDFTTAPATRVEAQRPAISITREAAPEPPTASPAVEVPPPVEVVKPAPKTKTARRVSAATRWFLALSEEQRSNVTALCEERVAHPCGRMFARLTRPEHDGEALEDLDEEPAEKFLAAFTAPQRQRATAYCQEVNKMPAPTCETPLVVAFDNQPIDFAVAGRNRFAFVPGEPVASDWPTAVTPWIARDLDGDGAITSGAELFGSSTSLTGGTTARNGFEALASLDANTDGALDARDPTFVTLLLWSDRNGDHRSTPDELRLLASVVTSIPLTPTLDPRCNARDACEGERGPLHWRDAAGIEHVGTVVDVYIPGR